MNFEGILYKKNYSADNLNSQAPAFFPDANLDQVIEAILKDKEEYNLKAFFYSPLRDAESIRYRQDILKDLEDIDVSESVSIFANDMAVLRKKMFLTGKAEYQYYKKRLALESFVFYAESIYAFQKSLTEVVIHSEGMLAFRDFLTDYIQSRRFTEPLQYARTIMAELSSVTYSVHFKELRVQVKEYREEEDLSAVVLKTFARFREENAKDYAYKYPSVVDMNHIEASIQEGVANLFPSVFAKLDDFYERYSVFPDEKIVSFDREVQFYVSFLAFIKGIRESGLKFCYPNVYDGYGAVSCREGFDLALANKFRSRQLPVVVNDFYLDEAERIIVVTGPNQGGKTTFARFFAQVHYLSALGLPVPGTEALIPVVDMIFTHFEKQEQMHNLRGKLQDDLVRVQEILEMATPLSVIILNEIFTSTTLQDATTLSRLILEKIEQLNALCVWVTFIDELNSLNSKTVSMVGAVDEENPDNRTFKILRKQADGLAYAISLARKYNLTYDAIRKRMNL